MNVALQSEIGALRTDAEMAKGEEGTKSLQTLISLRFELGDLLAAATTKDAAAGAIVLERSIVPEGGAVVAPIITEVGGKVLFAAAVEDGLAITAVDSPELTTSCVSELILRPAKDTKPDSWLAAYSKNYQMVALREAMRKLTWGSEEYRKLLDDRDKLMEEWLTSVGSLGSGLWELIGEKLSQELKKGSFEPGARLVWMPTGPLGILPIGLAEDPSTGKRLGETYEIVYAPSIDALAAASKNIEAAKRMLAAIAPAADLASTAFEVKYIASHFQSAASTTLHKQATSQAVLSALRGRNYWHFPTHGSFDWRDARNSFLQLSDGEKLSVGMLSDADGLGQPRLVALSACETGIYEFRQNASVGEVALAALSAAIESQRSIDLCAQSTRLSRKHVFSYPKAPPPGMK